MLVPSRRARGEAARAKRAATAQKRTSSWQTPPYAMFHQLRSQTFRSAFTFTSLSVIVWGFSAMEGSFAML